MKPINKEEKAYLKTLHEYLRANGVYNFLEFRGRKYRQLRINNGLVRFTDTTLTLDECKNISLDGMLAVVKKSTIKERNPVYDTN